MKSILYLIITSSLLFFSAATANATPSQYGPVKDGETLWYIAYKYKPAGVTRLQMMRAIHLHNRSSFNNGDINQLQKGAILRLPTNKQEVTQFIRGTAKVETIAEKGMPDELKKAHAELRLLREELAQSRSALNALKKESTQLSRGERDQFKKNIAHLQQKIVKLEEENATMKKGQTTSSDNNVNEALAQKTQALNKAYQEVAQLKQQNNLLKEQAAAKDNSVKQNQNKDKLVSETIAALNADIGKLRSRIKELEELEKLKDAHIAELKKTLQHATKVIKDQDAINRKMHAQLAELRANGATPMPQNAAILEPGDSKQAGVAPPLSEMVKSVSPKFWLLLTLGGLLLVLSLLWRSLSQRNFVEARDEPKVTDHK